MVDVGSRGGKANGRIDDVRAQATLFDQSSTQTRQHLFFGQIHATLFGDLLRFQEGV
jgi:hypothetical protein